MIAYVELFYGLTHTQPVESSARELSFRAGTFVALRREPALRERRAVRSGALHDVGSADNLHVIATATIL